MTRDGTLTMFKWKFKLKFHCVLFKGKEVHSLQAIHEGSGIKFIRRSSGE